MFNKMFDRFKLYEEAAVPQERIEAVRAAVFKNAGECLNIEKTAGKKPKRFIRKAVVIPAAIIIIGAATASAAGFGLYESFKGYFSQHGSSADKLSESDLSDYGRVIELDDYNVRINGFLCDRFSFLVSYDIEYKADKYFENGVLKEEYQNGSPVHFFVNADKGGGSGGSGRKISVSGSTASFVQEYGFTEPLEKSGNEYALKLLITFADTTEGAAGLRGNLREPMKLETSVSAGSEISLEINREIRSGGKTALLKSIDAGAMSLRFNLEGEEAPFDINEPVIKVTSVKMKDGREYEFSNIGIFFSNGLVTVSYQFDDFIEPGDICEIRFSTLIVYVENGAVTGTDAVQ